MIENKKDKLIKEAIETWCLYGKAVNKPADFNDFLLEGTTLMDVLESNSEENIIKFIEYFKKQTVLVEKIKSL
jgi:hypothetical protein